MRVTGLVSSIAHAALIAWIHASQPRTLAQATDGMASTVGASRQFCVAYAYYRQGWGRLYHDAGPWRRGGDLV